MEYWCGQPSSHTIYEQTSFAPKGSVKIDCFTSEESFYDECVKLGKLL